MSRPLVIAHRGASGECPENTAAAFERAIEQSADMIETDLHLSRDDVVVIHHDAALERLGEAGQIRDRTAAELLALNVDPRAASPATMPTLDDVLDRWVDRVAWHLELKVAADDAAYPGLEARVVEAVAGRGALPRILFSSFYDPVLARVREQSAEARIALLFSPRANFKVIERAQRLGAEAINPDVRLVDAALVADAHAAGLRVFPYTANDSAEMSRLLECGVDGIITNYPTRLHELLRERENA